MKSLFRKWLLFFIVLAFGLTFSLSWHLHRIEAKENALQLLEINLNDVAERVKRAENNLQTITEMSAASAIAKTRAFALLIKEKPSILQDSEVEFIPSLPMEISLKDCSIKEIQEKWHFWEVETADCVYLTLDLFYRGVGTGSCGPAPFDQYRNVGAGEHEFNLLIGAKKI